MKKSIKPPVMRCWPAVTVVLLSGLAVTMSADAVRSWTTVGSTGTVDSDSAAMVEFNGPQISLRTTCVFTMFKFRFWCSVATGTATIRYNVAEGYQYESPKGSIEPGYWLSARFRNAGGTQHVLISLKSVNLNSGAVNTLGTVDSNMFNPASDYQTQMAPGVFGLDFGQNAYYLEGQITNSGGSRVSPGIEALWIRPASQP